MTPDELAVCGSLLFGDHWQSALARDLGVDGRTVRRWVAGDSKIPDMARRVIIGLLGERVRGITTVLDAWSERPNRT